MIEFKVKNDDKFYKGIAQLLEAYPMGEDATSTILNLPQGHICGVMTSKGGILVSKAASLS